MPADRGRRVFAGWEVTLIAATLAAGVLHAAAAPPHFPAADPPAPSAHPRTTPPPVPPSTVEPARPTREPAPPARARPTPRTTQPPAVPTHPAEEDGRLLGWAFLLAAAFAGWAVWQLASRPRGRLFLAAVAAGHGLMVAAGLASRTVGLLGHKDPWWEIAFLLALACELVVVATATPRALRPPGAQPTREGVYA